MTTDDRADPGSDKAPDDGPGDGPDRDLHKLFEVWMDDETKLMITVFYQKNPGIIETVEGLARRLGTTKEAIQAAIADHVSMGLLKEKKVRDKVVLVYNRQGREGIEDFIAEQLRKRLEDA